MKRIPLDVAEARIILRAKEIAVPLNEPYLVALVTIAVQVINNPMRMRMEVRLTEENFDRLNCASKTASNALEALITEYAPERGTPIFAFQEDGRTIEVKFYPH